MEIKRDKGFARQDFMAYLERAVNGFSNPFLRELVDNLIDYGLKHEHVSKDMFCYWLSDILPEISFDEIAAFMEDKCLTDNGIKYKREAMADFDIYYKIEVSLSRKEGYDDDAKTSVAGEDLFSVKSEIEDAISRVLKEQDCPAGYYNVGIMITFNGEYYDSEEDALIYYDKDTNTVKHAHVVGLNISGRSNLSNLAIDYIELKLADDSIVTLDWDESEWDSDLPPDVFFISLPAIAVNNEPYLNGGYIDAKMIESAKAISAIQVYSDQRNENPVFEIHDIQIFEDGINVGELVKPEIQTIYYEFDGK